VSDTTISVALELASAACADLGELGETVEDEWSYVTDLAAAWAARLDAVSAARGAEPIDDATLGAIEAVIDEAGLIADPHRAIDWLSTFPQVVLLALGEPP
jgi:hypothetical protein